MDFNKRLRHMRIVRNFTQPYVADSIGTTLRNYQKYEQGKARPPYETLVKLATILNVSTDYLLGLTDEEPVDE